MIRYCDVTLRDGNHALRHTLSTEFVRNYCAAADAAGVWSVEVGHGNGLGASSFLVGKSSCSDEALLMAARESLRSARLGVFAIPGFATINRDLRPALEIGADVFRIGSHVTEASLAEKHIEFLATQGVTVHAVLMMSHMIDLAGLVEQARLMESYGASAVILMDSAGHLRPQDVAERVASIKTELSLEVGFHAHNNLGLAVANAISAIAAGATIIDGSSMGLGAGAGNAALECLLGVAEYEADVSLDPYLAMSRLVAATFPDKLPRTTATSIESGRAGVFSGFAPYVSQAAEEFGIAQRDLWQALGERSIIAGQESIIREIAMELAAAS